MNIKLLIAALLVAGLTGCGDKNDLQGYLAGNTWVCDYSELHNMDSLRIISYSPKGSFWGRSVMRYEANGPEIRASFKGEWSALAMELTENYKSHSVNGWNGMPQSAVDEFDQYFREQSGKFLQTLNVTDENNFELVSTSAGQANIKCKKVQAD